MSKLFLLLALSFFFLKTNAQTQYPVNTGGLSDPDKWKGEKWSEGLGFSDVLPKTFSLKQFCPTPADQGQLATCTGWSVAYGARTILLAMQKKLSNQEQITAEAFDPMFLFNSLKGDHQPECDYGVELGHAVDFLVKSGAVSIKDYQLDCSDAVTGEMKNSARHYRANGYQILFSYYEPEVASKVKPVKAALANGQPVVCNILTYFPPKSAAFVKSYRPSFWDVKNLWQPTVQELNYHVSDFGGPHNVVIVGYDDEKFGGAFELMNSYGTGWGDNGFFWITYEDFYYVGNGGMSVY